MLNVYSHLLFFLLFEYKYKKIGLFVNLMFWKGLVQIYNQMYEKKIQKIMNGAMPLELKIGIKYFKKV